MIEPCHLSLDTSIERIIGVVGGSGHDGSAVARAIHPSLYCKISICYSQWCFYIVIMPYRDT
jgi:hypothetical protein